MSTVVKTEIKRRRDTTANWNYINPILQDRVLGFEVDGSNNPIGMKMGDGINTWDDLPYWFGSSITLRLDKVSNPGLAAGQTIPFFVDISLYPQFGKLSEVTTWSPDSTGELKKWSDMDVIATDTNGDGTGTFTGWNVTGHNDGTVLTEDLTIDLSGGSGTISGTPIGPVGGDLGGSLPNPTVARFNGQLPAYYLDYTNLTGVPTAVSTFTNDANYSQIVGNTAVPGLTTNATILTVANSDPINAISYKIGAWALILSISGGFQIKVNVSFFANGSNFIKDFYIQGAVSPALDTVDFFPLPSIDIRVDPLTNIVVQTQVITGTGAIVYECGASIIRLG